MITPDKYRAKTEIPTGITTKIVALILSKRLTAFIQYISKNRLIIAAKILKTGTAKKGSKIVENKTALKLFLNFARLPKILASIKRTRLKKNNVANKKPACWIQ